MHVEFTILAKIPNLDFNEEISHEHMIVAFKAAVESYRIILMIHHYSKTIAKNFSSVEDLVKSFESNYGKFPNKIENDIQSGLVDVLSVENYNEFFSHLDVTRTDEEIFDTLKRAFNLSAERGYHGNLKKAFESKKTEFTTHNFNIYNPKTLIQVYESNQQSLDVSEETAKKILVETFLWIRRSIYSRNDMTPAQLAHFSDGIDYKYNKVNHELPDPLVVARNKYKNQYVVEGESCFEMVYPETFSWKELMIKLLFEQQVRSLEWEQDFPALHKALNILKDVSFRGLVLYVIDVSNIKMK